MLQRNFQGYTDDRSHILLGFGASSISTFTDGFVQDLQGEATTCRECKQSVRVTPVVLVHDKHEKQRFEAMFGTAFEADLEVSRN